MKIGHPADKPAAVATPGTQPAATDHTKPVHGGAASPPAHVPDASAKVELSSTAATLLSGGTAAEFDADKVARISQAISAGTFRINPEAIADKLIGNAQELLTKVQG